MKTFNFILAIMFAAQTAFAGVIADDNLDLGKPSSTATKSLTFKGPTKKKLSSTNAGALGYDGNTLSVGDGTNLTDKLFQFDKGGTNPFWKYDFATGEMQSGNSSAISHGANTLKVGDGTNSNKVLRFNKGASSPEIRYNSTTSKLEFSNDASLYKAIGSGTGGGGDGGKNLLLNPSFEDGISIDWSNTGGTFTQGTYTNGTEDDTKYANFVATTSGQYFETALKTVPDSLGAGCMSDLKYFGGSGNFKLQALDSSANVLSEIVLVNTTSWQKSPTIAYPCPAAGATMRARIISTAAGTIQGDLVYLGGNKNISQVAQARLFAEVVYANGLSSATASTTFVDASATGTGAAYSNSSAPTGNRVGLTMPYMPKGRYMIIATGFGAGAGATATNSASYGSFAASDIPTTTTCGFITVQGNLNGQTDVTSGGDFTCMYTVTSPLTAKEFWLKQRALTGTVSIFAAIGGKISVYYFPTDAEYAVTNDQSSWLIDANIGGATFGLAGIQSTFTEITNGSLDLVIGASKGSATAEIPCSSTNPSTGLTCAVGNESLGLAFTPPYAGQFEICGDFWVSNASATYKTYQWVETPNNAQTILQEGGQRTGGGGTPTDFSMHVCGTFNFTSTAKRTVRLMYEAADANSSSIALGRDANLGQRDLKITVRPILQSVPRPILTGDQVTSPGLTNPKTFAVEWGGASRTLVCTSSPCTLYYNAGNFVTSVTHVSTGAYAVNVTAGKFTGTNFTCSYAIASGSDSRTCGIQITSNTLINVNCASPNVTPADQSIALTCLGF